MVIMSSILDFFKKYATEPLIGYFLMLWGIENLIGVVWGLAFDLSGFRLSTLLDLLWIVTDLFQGLILIVLGLRIRSRETI